MKIEFGLAEGQVLQRIGTRGATATLRGSAELEGAITATITNARGPLKGWKKKAVGKAARGVFNLKLVAIPAGGPYRLKLECGKKSVEVRSFFVGDVWILSGQSNMEGVGWMTGAAKPNPLVRSFSMRHEWRLAEDPLHMLIESPDICHNNGVQAPSSYVERRRRNARKGVSVGVFFGKEMLRRSGVPQALICTAHGGTSMEQWSPERRDLGGESLYASMMASIAATGQPVAGMLWYQGESDTGAVSADVYPEKMKELVAAVRDDLRQPKLPWVIVQISRVTGRPNNHEYWNLIQEQQRLLPGKIKNLETVSAVDLPLDDAIHIGAAGFPRLALRMARAADRLVYGNKRETRPPQLESIRPLNVPPDYVIEVSFNNVKGGLCANAAPTGFTLLTPEGQPAPVIFKTTLEGNTARLHLIKPLWRGAKLSYGFGADPICNITDAEDNALLVFGPVAVDLQQDVTPYLSFVRQWKVTGVIAAEGELDAISLPDLDALGCETKRYDENGFINERPQWERKEGQAYFQTTIELSEPMSLDFLMGYDGPFRLWLDGKPFFADVFGANPCLPDKARKSARLGKGTHDIRVGMDLDFGRSWGFFLRFARTDVPKARLAADDYAKPAYW